MPVPIAAALPWIASAVGTALPMIVDAFRSGKSPEEAAKVIAPMRQQVIDRLVGAGMPMAAAEKEADMQLAGELEKAKLPEPMSPWLSLGLAAVGGLGGYKLGKMAKARMTPKGTPEAPKVDTPAEQAATAPARKAAEPDVYTPGFESPSVAAARGGALDRVTGASPFPPARLGYDAPPRTVDAVVVGRSPFPSPPMDPDFAALNLGGQAPGRSTRRFTMQDAGPFGIGMSPELENRLTREAMMARMYRYEGG